MIDHMRHKSNLDSQKQPMSLFNNKRRIKNPNLGWTKARACITRCSMGCNPEQGVKKLWIISLGEGGF